MTTTTTMYLTWFLLILTDSILLLTVESTSSFPVDPQPISPSASNCQPTDKQFCDIPNYEVVKPFNNSFGHANFDAAKADLNKFFYLTLNPVCKEKIQLFLCSLYLPVCTIPMLLPCREDCEAAYETCHAEKMFENGLSWPIEWNCENFNYFSINPLCVTNTAKSNDNNQTASPPRFTTDAPPLITAPSESNCGGLFDCREKSGILCIDRGLLCDGRVDCLESKRDEKISEACPWKQCAADQISCDDKCVTRPQICDGKVDCSDGVDEQNCTFDGDGTGFSNGTMQALWVSLLLLVVIYSLVKLFKNDNQKSEVDDERPKLDQPPVESLMRTPSDVDLVQHVILTYSDLQPYMSNNNIEAIDHRFNAYDSASKSHLYQETYPESTKSAHYERVNDGGFSGASSIYNYASIHNGSTKSTSCIIGPNVALGSTYYESASRLPPAAPPPTPAATPPQQIYNIDYDNES